MKFEPATYHLPSGEEIIIRIAAEKDADALIALKKRYIKGTRSIPMYDYEYTNDTDQECSLIQKYHDEENSLCLVAEHNGNLIGNIDLTGNQRKKLFHTGMIGMGIAHEWQNLSIGSLLMENILKRALGSPLKIIGLEVYGDNAAGIRLYEKVGFEQCGLIKGFFMENGPVDKITMVKYISL